MWSVATPVQATILRHHKQTPNVSNETKIILIKYLLVTFPSLLTHYLDVIGVGYSKLPYQQKSPIIIIQCHPPEILLLTVTS